MQDYRSQALMMLALWGQEMERLEARSKHPLQAVRESPGRQDGAPKSKKPNVHAVETRRSRPQRVPINELSAAAKRVDRILRFVRDEDEKAYRALELMAFGVRHAEASRSLRMNEHEHRASVRVGVSLMSAILRLRAM